LAKQNFNALIAEFEALDKRIAEIDRKLIAILKGNEISGSQRGQERRCFKERPDRFTHPMLS